MGLFMCDFSGRCWITLPGRCVVYLVEMPSRPAALWLHQYNCELDIKYSAFPQALLAWALCCANWLCSGADFCPAGWERDESLLQTQRRLI